MILFGGLALILCTFLLGLLWRHAHPLDLGATLWGYFVKSIYLAWLWFALSYHTDVGDAARAITVLLAAVVLYAATVRPIPVEGSSDQTNLPLRIALAAIVFFLLAYPAAAGLGSIFTEWDAVASWNRWANELSREQYRPVDAAYPILWPGVWSVIYEAQGTPEIWFLAKASIGAPVVFAAAYLAHRVHARNLVSGLFVAFLVYDAFISETKFIVSGYMDLPLALTGLIGMFVTYQALVEEERAKKVALLQVAAITFAIALVTKQAGAIFASWFVVLCLVEWRRGKISFRSGVEFFVILIAPLLIFLWIFLDTGRSLIGNLDTLEAIADRARGETSAIAHALNLMREPVWDFSLLLILGGALANIVWFRSVQGMAGLLSLLIAVVVFFIFADCCSYNVRNGYVIYSFAIFSAFVGVQSLVKHATRVWLRADGSDSRDQAPATDLRKVVATGAAAAGFSLIALAIEYPNEALAKRHTEKLSRDLHSPAAYAFLEENRKVLEETPIISSYYQMLRYTPWTASRYSYCQVASQDCFDRTFAQRTGDYLVVMTATFIETPASAEFLSELEEAGVATKVSAEHGWLRLMRVDRDKWTAWKSENE